MSQLRRIRRQLLGQALGQERGIGAGKRRLAACNLSFCAVVPVGSPLHEIPAAHQGKGSLSRAMTRDGVLTGSAARSSSTWKGRRGSWALPAEGRRIPGKPESARWGNVRRMEGAVLTVPTYRQKYSN